MEAKTLAKYRMLRLVEMRKIREAAGLSTVFCRYQFFHGTQWNLIEKA